MTVSRGAGATPPVGESDAARRDRENDLVNRYTARELAAQLAGTEALCRREQTTLRRFQAALVDIAGGSWTGKGAAEVARKVLRDDIA